MEADTIDAIDNFINDASDQAAAWYSIITSKPVAVPSATIAVQTAQAQAVAASPVVGVVSTPLGTTLDISTLVLLIGVAAIAWFAFKG